MKTLPRLVTLATLGLLAAAAGAQTPAPPPAAKAPAMSANEKAVWQAEWDWRKAIASNDVETMTGLELREFTFTDSLGHAHSRAELQAIDESGAVHLTEDSLHEAAAHIIGDTAIVTGRVVAKGIIKGNPFGELAEVTDTLVRHDGAWRFAASHVTRLSALQDSATTPVWRDGGGWLKRHAGFVEDARKGGVDLLFVGDSITDFWRTRGKAVWDEHYGALHAANIGISGDRTQHLLWRLENGEVDGLSPKAIVLMIGTNNTGLERDLMTPRNTPAEAAEGIKAVVAKLREKMPDAKILLLAVFPRGNTPDNSQRIQVAEINRMIAGLDDGDHVRYLDIGSKFLTPDGILNADIMPDYLHPSAKGYAIWADAIDDSLKSLMQ